MDILFKQCADRVRLSALWGLSDGVYKKTNKNAHLSRRCGTWVLKTFTTKRIVQGGDT